MRLSRYLSRLVGWLDAARAAAQVPAQAAMLRRVRAYILLARRTCRRSWMRGHMPTVQVSAGAYQCARDAYREMCDVTCQLERMAWLGGAYVRMYLLDAQVCMTSVVLCEVAGIYRDMAARKGAIV